jgi:hypothetical protein
LATHPVGALLSDRRKPLPSVNATQVGASGNAQQASPPPAGPGAGGM